jgi:hypothetical protein
MLLQFLTPQTIQPDKRQNQTYTGLELVVSAGGRMDDFKQGKKKHFELESKQKSDWDAQVPCIQIQFQ